MSALGQKQTSALQKGMSALPLKAEHCLRHWLDKLATAHIGDRAIQSKSVRSVFARIFSRRNP